MKFSRQETVYFCHNCLYPYMLQINDGFTNYRCGRCGFQMGPNGRVAVSYTREWED